MTTTTKEVISKMQDEGWDETYVEPYEPHKPYLEDGKRYSAKVTGVRVLKDQPTWNSETKRFDTTKVVDKLEYPVAIPGVTVDPPLSFKVTKSNHEKSNLYRLAKEFGFLPADLSKEGISGKKLVGRMCRLKIVHSKPSPKTGSVFDNVDISSIEALNDAADYEAVRDRI